jgi:hypothetical protein
MCSLGMIAEPMGSTHPSLTRLAVALQQPTFAII